MRPLNELEMRFVTECPCVLNEEVIRPKRYKGILFSERIENAFIELEPFFDNIYNKKNEEMIKLAFWFVYVGKYEKELSDETLFSYVCENCHFNTSRYIKKYRHDIELIINNL